MDAYNNHVKGCNKKCPCPLWVNCEYYRDKKAQEWRLKHKMLDPEISEYYQHHFISYWCMHDLYSNG